MLSLARADIGSPWLPVVMMTSLLSGMFLVIFRSTSVPAGMSRYPSSRASATTFSMLRPEIATLRPIFTAFSIILCTLWTLDEKVAIIILELEVLKIFSMVCPTTFSEAVYPGLIERGAVAHHQGDALLAQLSQTAEINGFTVYRSIVDLKVSCMEDHPGRRIYGQTYGVSNGMGRP